MPSNQSENGGGTSDPARDAAHAYDQRQQQLEIEMLKKRSAADPPETERRQPSQGAVAKKRRRNGDGEGEQAAPKWAKPGDVMVGKLPV